MYSISKFFVDTNDNVVSLDWCYENSDGKLSSRWVLHTPVGATPIVRVYESTLIGWLQAQLPETEQNLIDVLSARATRETYEDSLRCFTPSDVAPVQVYNQSY